MIDRDAVPPFPQHAKLQQVHASSLAISEFIDWLADRQMAIGKAGPAGSALKFVETDAAELLAEYFQIDLEELDRETEQLVTDPPPVECHAEREQAAHEAPAPAPSSAPPPRLSVAATLIGVALVCLAGAQIA